MELSKDIGFRSQMGSTMSGFGGVHHKSSVKKEKVERRYKEKNRAGASASLDIMRAMIYSLTGSMFSN